LSNELQTDVFISLRKWRSTPLCNKLDNKTRRFFAIFDLSSFITASRILPVSQSRVSAAAVGGLLRRQSAVKPTTEVVRLQLKKSSSDLSPP